MVETTPENATDSVALPTGEARNPNLPALGRTGSALTVAKVIAKEGTTWIGVFGASIMAWSFGVLTVFFFVGFLYSWDYDRDLIAWFFDGKPVNWIITAAFLSGIAFLVREHRNRITVIPPQPYHRAETAVVPRFKLGGVYGSANAADDCEVDEALRGNTGGFAPMFEE